jgi:hypothetical protein
MPNTGQIDSITAGMVGSFEKYAGGKSVCGSVGICRQSPKRFFFSGRKSGDVTRGVIAEALDAIRAGGAAGGMDKAHARNVVADAAWF